MRHNFIDHSTFGVNLQQAPGVYSKRSHKNTTISRQSQGICIQALSPKQKKRVHICQPFCLDYLNRGRFLFKVVVGSAVFVADVSSVVLTGNVNV